MSLQRRLLVYLALCAPIVWGAALLVSIERARHEVNELFDSELIRLARQVQAMTPANAAPAPSATAGPADKSTEAAGTGSGAAELGDLAVAVWDADGRRVLAHGDHVDLPHRAAAPGFMDDRIAGEAWRVYYLPSADGRLVAAGQKTYERDELVFDLTSSQIGPWLLVLPVLLLAMAWAVRRALAPVRVLSAELQRRRADNLAAVPEAGVPTELRPLVHAMNGLFSRVSEMLERERRFTADAAHELRTPLAVLRAQWDVVRRSSDLEGGLAGAKVEAGLERMDRLVTQLLALSRAEAASTALLTEEIDWAAIVERVMTDCMPLARRRRVELACGWAAGGRPAFPLQGSSVLLTVLLRNLVDNAVRYGPAGSTVTVRMETDRIEVENEGEPLSPDAIAILGDRFSRPAGQQETGSGLGLSIVRRIATLHGIELHHGSGEGGRGVRAVLDYAPPPLVNGS